MGELRVYIAVSIDGFIAAPGGGVTWLDRFQSPEFDFPGFLARIGTVVVGRRTFDQSLTFPEWSYGDARVIVQTRRPLPQLSRPVERFDGDVRDLARAVRADTKDVWLVGGGESIRTFAKRGLVDVWELWVIPVLLGSGVPLFLPRGHAIEDLRTESTRAYGNGVVRLTYRR